MINSTNTINIDGTTINQDDIVNTFSFDKDDRFSRWVLRPLAVLTMLGMGVAAFFASAFLIIISLAMLPLLAVSMWVMKTKIKRDVAAAESVVSVQE